MPYFPGYFSAAIIVIVVAVFIRAARGNALKESSFKDRMNFVVCAPKAYKVVGIICSGLFGVAFVASTFAMAGDGDYPWVAAIFIAFLALGLFLLHYSIHWKLVVAGDTLVLTPLFGKDRTYSVRDITHIKLDIYMGVKVYSGDRKLFNVDRYSTGTAMFISYLIEKGVKAPNRIII